MRSLLFCQSRNPNYKSKAASDMRGKFTRGNPQEFQRQISSHSETEQVRRANSTSSIIMGRNA